TLLRVRSPMNPIDIGADPPAKGNHPRERSPIRLDGPELQGNSLAQNDLDGLNLAFHVESGVSVQEPIPTGLGLVARKSRAHEIRLRTLNHQVAFSLQPGDREIPLVIAGSRMIIELQIAAIVGIAPFGLI